MKKLSMSKTETTHLRIDDNCGRKTATSTNTYGLYWLLYVLGNEWLVERKILVRYLAYQVLKLNLLYVRFVVNASQKIIAFLLECFSVSRQTAGDVFAG